MRNNKDRKNPYSKAASAKAPEAESNPPAEIESDPPAEIESVPPAEAEVDPPAPVDNASAPPAKAAPAPSAKSASAMPAKAASPARKKTFNRESNKFKGKVSNANQVRYRRVSSIDGLAVAHFLRSNGSDPAYTGSIFPNIESNTSHMSHCGITLITTLRNPNGTNEPLQKVNKAGNSYPVTVTVILTDEGVSLSQAASNIAKTMTNIAKNECKTEWNFGTPVFVNKGDASPPTLLPLSHYLVDFDCITVMKRIFEGTDTKDDMLNKNKDRDEILNMVFGDANKGFEVIENLEDSIYEEL